MKSIEVGKISLKIGKKKQIDLSLEEARELQQVLTDLFGNQDSNVPVIVTPIVTPIVYPTPIYPGRYKWWKVEPTWGNDNTSTDTVTISNGSIEDSGSYVIS